MTVSHKTTLLAISLLITQTTVTAAPAYTLQGLGDLAGGRFESAAIDLNDRGQVVGKSVSSNGTEGFIWDPVNGMVALGNLAGYSSGSAYGINERGEVAGFSEIGSATAEAYIWTSTSGLVSIGDLPGGPLRGRARAINNAGEIVGSAESEAGRRAFRWDARNGMIDLGLVDSSDLASLAYHINNAGQVIGRNDGRNRAGSGDGFVWSPQTCSMTTFGDLPGGTTVDTTARRINDRGQVVGNSNSSNGIEAFLWDPINGVQGLGDLPGGSFESRAFGINDQGQVVGTGTTEAGSSAFLWTETDGILEIASLITDGTATGWLLSASRQINNRGQIIGFGTNPEGNLEAWLATPVSTCATTP